MDPLFPIAPEDLAALSAEEIEEFIDEVHARVGEVAADPAAFVAEDRTAAQVIAEMRAAVEALEAAEAELSTREVEEPEIEPEPELSAEELAAQVAELASRAAPPAEPVLEPELPVEPAPEPEPVQAAAVPQLRPPARGQAAAPRPAPPLVSFTAAAGGLGPDIGESLDLLTVGEMMIRKHRQFGRVGLGAEEKITVAKADWRGLYPADRKLGGDIGENTSLIAAATDRRRMREELGRRKKDSLVASGGLCAPVTPYYNLQELSQADRPVRAALPSFNADRGGIRFAAPATLGAVTTAIDIHTAAEDSVGGTTATKTCQTIACPEFSEVDVEIISHCIQFGNLGARTFPELLAQWNQLVLAAHARTAETVLLDGIAAASTAVTADAGALGAAGDFPAQVLTAAAAMRSRHRMDPETVFRALIPDWVLDMMVSDVYKSQFGRFDMTEQAFVALLRASGIEPTFYLDGATGAGQVFGAQGAGVLLAFPTTTEWYLFPEGSFLYVDGGVLELGLVRDSVLNETNDFQIFGESFENVAFVGVESLQIRSNLCDSGSTAALSTADCPTNYA